MFKNTIFRRMTALVLTLALAAAAALPGLAVYPMPIQTASETEAVYLFNADTGKTILNQNADQQQYVASLTKLMTALLLLESGKDLNGEVTVPTALTQEFRDIQNANGTTMGLRIGETVRRIDLLNAMLIVSANDAASVIAWDVGGSVVGFVQQMDAKAAALGWMKGRRVPEVEAFSMDFCLHVLVPQLYPEGLKALRQEQARGASVLLITASPSFYLEPLEAMLGVEAVIGTRMNVDDRERYTGDICGDNCRGVQKPLRLAEYLAARGDS